MGSAGLFLCETHARRCADRSDAQEEDNLGKDGSVPNFSDSKQKIAYDQIQ
jgi:hypothetical protein